MCTRHIMETKLCTTDQIKYNKRNVDRLDVSGSTLSGVPIYIHTVYTYI